MFKGSFVALITPFTDGKVDIPALRKLVNFHLGNNTHGFVPVGTTGEASTLSVEEFRQVVETVVSECNKRLPVIAGAGSNDPTRANKYAGIAAEHAADAVLHVMGYYNRPSQEGIYQHFKVLSNTSPLPVFVYNVPPRTIIDIQPETMARIASLEHIIGVKDATCDLSRPVREKLLIQNPDFVYLSGEDPTAVAYNAQGGQGCISVTANVAPSLCATMQQACADGDYRAALEIQQRLMPLHRALFQEPSPAGVKYACSLLGLCEDTCRLPIVELTRDTKATIQAVMSDLSLI
jgi:4-hydroxy-tetrahydrodipicolinate synthase